MISRVIHDEGTTGCSFNIYIGMCVRLTLARPRGAASRQNEFIKTALRARLGTVLLFLERTRDF